MSENVFGVDQELLNEFVDESCEILSSTANLFVVLESDPTNKEAIDNVFRAVHTIKGSAAFFNLLKVKSLAHIMEDMMDLVREGVAGFNSTMASLLIQGTDMLKGMMECARKGQCELEDLEAYNVLLKDITEQVVSIRRKDSGTVWKKIEKDIRSFRDKFVTDDHALMDIFRRLEINISAISPFNAIGSATDVQKEQGGVSGSDTVKQDGKITEKKTGSPLEEIPAAGRTMRVSEAAIDNFLEFIGELVMVEETYDHLEKRLKEEFGLTSKVVMNLKKNNESFRTLSYSLQKSLLEVRKVSLKVLTQKAPRIVRDIAKDRNKDIKLEVRGDDKLIDKSLAEALDGPFTHILRNSADHGIESIDERQKKGKPAQGKVVIDISEDEEDMLISIQDDGAGIDVEAVKEKAISSGIVTAEDVAKMKPQDVYQLLFLPGFSTAKTVTDISGRGVGMDVVKRNIESIGGKVITESEIGAGSKFTLKFPKSVAVKIMQGLIVT
ncbi:MAG TPA: ATP-binding protein, partial [Candidatus Omnitrophota bacterium]|nr:ATP-binding protein [Candidatus Omnitrophota bacterium]